MNGKVTLLQHAGHSVNATIEDKEYTVPVETVEVSDVTGAGDCFILDLFMD